MIHIKVDCRVIQKRYNSGIIEPKHVSYNRKATKPRPNYPLREINPLTMWFMSMRPPRPCGLCQCDHQETIENSHRLGIGMNL